MKVGLASAIGLGSAALVVALAAAARQGVGPSERTGDPSGHASFATVASFAGSDAGRRSLRGGSSEAPRHGGTMTQSVTASYGTLNNITRTKSGEELVCRTYLFPPLLDLDPDTFEIVPLVAASRPEISPDHRRYTWRIRPGIRWHRGLPDGSPVELSTADVEFSWRMIADTRSGAVKAKGALGPVESVKAVDRYTFVVETSAPYFRSELEFGYDFRIMPAHLCTQDPEAFGKDPLGRAPVGYGPYRFDEWKEGAYLSLVRNPEWFAPEKLPYWVDRVRIHFVPDVNQVPTLFERGELTLVAVNDCSRYEEMRKDAAWLERATFHEYYLPHVVFITWNGLHPAFADPRVRRAMTLLNPRDLVRDKIYRGHAQVVSGPWAVTARECDPSIAPLPFDPPAAAALLDEAGWQDHDGDGWRDKYGKALRFVLEYSQTTAPVFTVGLGWFQEQLKAAGVAMETRAVELNQLAAELGEHRYDAAMLGWVADPRDDDVYDRFHSDAIDAGSNYGSYRSAECDRLVEAFRAEFDESARLKVAHAIHRRLAEDQPCTFLYNPQSLVLVSTKLRNVKLHAMGARWFDWWFAE